MPIILPTEPLASWPPNEGAIGVVGVAPWATLDFLQSLYSLINAEKDWHYPRVIADINTKIPSRGRYLQLSERNPSPFIRASIAELAEVGATVVVVPCNTAHILYTEWQYGSAVKVPSIIDATVTEIESYKVNRVAVLASSAIAQYKIYDTAIKKTGLSNIKLSEQQQEIVTDLINQVKISEQPNIEKLEQFDNLLYQLAEQGVDGLILGCTELKGFEPRCKGVFNGVAESNYALAKVALKLANISTANHNGL